MKKTLLELLKVREINNPIDFANYRFDIPPIFKIFLETYEIPKDGMIEEIQVFNPLSNSLRSFGTYDCVAKVYTGFAYFLKIEDAVSILDKVYAKKDIIFEMNLMPIASGLGQDIILLGIGKDNADKIFLETNLPDDLPIEERLIFLCDNIFELFRGLVWSPEERYIERTFKTTDKLYRNWNEDFWRVREDKEGTE